MRNPMAWVTAHNVKTATPELSRRGITSKRVPEEVASLLASCQRIQKRLAGKPGDAKLTDLFSKQETKLHLAIAAMNAGRTYRHR